MVQVIHALLPIVLLVALGAVLLRSRFLDEKLCRGLDRLVYWVALPCLIVAKLSDAPPIGGEAVRMVVALGGVTVLVMAATYAGAKLMRLRAESVGVITQAAFRGNLAFIGLPVIDLVTGGSATAIAKAALLLAPMVILYNVLAVIGLVMAHHRFDRRAVVRLSISLITNPLLIACAVGFGLTFTTVSIPPPIWATLNLLGDVAAPLALLSLGGALVTYPVRANLPAALSCAGIKLGVLPALTFAAAWLLGVTGQDLSTTLIFAAAPTAVASYVLAGQLGGDRALAAATIVISTIASALSLGVAIALGQ